MKLPAYLMPLLLAIPLYGQNAPANTNQWSALAFLEGTWDAKASSSKEAAETGSYTFRLELQDHILARHGDISQCKGSSSFDCDHNDLLYLYHDGSNQTLKAIYFDNEGHVINYDVTTPSSTSAVFLSDGSQPGPQFRLTYELKSQVMYGAFQMKMPGQQDWKSYLEWSGGKHQ
jgi:uncharacterized protein YaiE (UPF0345 family)